MTTYTTILVTALCVAIPTGLLALAFVNWLYRHIRFSPALHSGLCALFGMCLSGVVCLVLIARSSRW
jgi:hypothetical protein